MSDKIFYVPDALEPGVRYVENPDGTCEPQRLPDWVIRVDDNGLLITEEKLLNNGAYRKVTGRIPLSPYRNRHWTDEEVKELPEITHYYSMVDNGYIGDKVIFELLVNKRGLILIQKALPEHKTCSIGYSPKENKWYGWSHRAIHGFTIGDVVEQGDLCADSGLIEEYRVQHPEEDHSLPVGFKALTLNDARRMAIAFACAVG